MLKIFTHCLSEVQILTACMFVLNVITLLLTHPEQLRERGRGGGWPCHWKGKFQWGTFSVCPGRKQVGKWEGRRRQADCVGRQWKIRKHCGPLVWGERRKEKGEGLLWGGFADLASTPSIPLPRYLWPFQDFPTPLGSPNPVVKVHPQSSTHSEGGWGHE